MSIMDYRDLNAWRRAMDLVEEVYKATKSFPREETYGLTSQIRRAVVSVPSNIAEGQGRRSTKEFLNSISIAYGSLRETETQIMIAGRLGYLESARVDGLMSLAAEVGRLMNGLSNALRRKTTGRSAADRGD